MINSISSINPISSIVSASSITKNLIQSRLITLLSMKSISLPGVATTILGPLFNAALCILGDSPPQIFVTLNCLYVAISLRSFVTCCDNSLVGTTTRASISRVFSLIFWTIGMPNANVFPVPVFD